MEIDSLKLVCNSLNSLKDGKFSSLVITHYKRILTYLKPDFVHVSMDGAEYLVRRGIAAVGIDSLGIQKFHSGNMKVHEVFLRKKIPVFEGLNLKGVPAGRYLFVGLPLKLETEAAPARVILVQGL